MDRTALLSTFACAQVFVWLIRFQVGILVIFSKCLPLFMFVLFLYTLSLFQ